MRARRPGRTIARLMLLAFCWAAMTGLSTRGCTGLFTPAKPETGGAPVVIPNYRTPEATLSTLTKALNAKANGSAAWLGAFSDSTGPGVPAYHQFFDLTDLTVFQSSCQCLAPTDWGVTQEQAFYLQFLNVRPSDTYSMSFEVVDSNPDQPPGDTQAVLHRHYHVYATSPDQSSTQIIAIGYCDLILTAVSSDRWLVTRWDDHLDPAVGSNPVDPYQLSLGRRRLESSQ
ncbi:MAG: hypothetical protein HY076_05325 [Candidatus Eisenbacteria bacterium]|uniref:Uncharacterized protein n=1 Tax=Eiseniibacteriota bacterium TaxID=2212470 RepID=A0A9D6L883_UNCEI|nr:hypothetical protein [Candidatus Eisenbacteria bacterium]